MNSKGLTIATILLAGLAGLLWWSSHRKPAEETTTAASSPKILDVNQLNIVKVDLKKKGQDELALAKDESGKWQMKSPQSLRLDQDAVGAMLSLASSLNSERVVEEKAGDLAQYGLAQPALEFNITEKDGKTHKLLVGDDTPASGGVYAALAGDPRVFTVASYIKSSIDKGPADLRDKRLLAAEADKVSRLELLANKQDIEFGRANSGWQILKPKPLRADSSTVSDFLRKVAEAKMQSAAATAEEEKKNASAFATGVPVATIKLTDPSGIQQLEVRKSKDAYYAKSSAVDGIYKVQPLLGQDLGKNLDDFRDKKLFDFGFADPDKIEIHDGSKSYLFTKSGQDWMASGSKLENSSVQLLAGKLRELSAKKFLDSGFGAPLLDATVTSSAGKVTEKVLISKSGADYIAKRENEPALYQLESGDVEALQKAAADVKPAVETKPTPKK